MLFKSGSVEINAPDFTFRLTMFASPLLQQDEMNHLQLLLSDEICCVSMALAVE